MNNIIICEGATDLALLQYYMREACGWTDDRNSQKGILRMQGQRSRNLVKDSNILTIMSTGGCSQIKRGFIEVLNRIDLSMPDLSDVYNKIVIVRDNDDVDTEGVFYGDIKSVFIEKGISYEGDINNNQWIQCKMNIRLGLEVEFQVLLLVVPFEKNGAMETFLLNAVSEDNPYDKVIIDKCNDFVDNVDPEARYLNSRRIITKAKFDTYFSVRTAAGQFGERDNILKGVKWEQYTRIQKDFAKLSEM